MVADGSVLEVGVAGTVQCCYSEGHCVGGSGHHGQWFVDVLLVTLVVHRIW